MPLELVTPPIGTLADCRTCGRLATWDAVHGWMHVATGHPPDTPPHPASIDWAPR
ncbi:hypothetical protein [Hamadaea tsunoensis]|uniref:hypothetical protein n=1 Tax=Hamadaea tsunoensis TaxID=53368 RepID=UPI00041E5EE3|nr:hypothetical protein [Hamadaea tsunoensis]